MQRPVGAPQRSVSPAPRSPPKTERSGVGLERALEANTPTPSRKARKLILPRAYSASAGLMPRSHVMQRSFRTHRLRLCPTRGSTPGWYAAPRWGTPKAVSPTPRSPPKNRSGAVSGRSEPWRRTPQPPRAQRESSSSPEPTQRAEA